VRDFRDFWRQKGDRRLGKAKIPARRYQWKGKRALRDGPELGLEGRAVKWISNINLYTSELSCKRYTNIKRYLHTSERFYTPHIESDRRSTEAVESNTVVSPPKRNRKGRIDSREVVQSFRANI
jgi:hypothetical protein